jgi:hypothetical protein
VKAASLCRHSELRAGAFARTDRIICSRLSQPHSAQGERISTSEDQSDSNFPSSHGYDETEVVCDSEQEIVCDSQEEDGDDMDLHDEDYCLTDDEDCDFPGSEEEGSAFSNAFESMNPVYDETA